MPVGNYSFCHLRNVHDHTCRGELEGSKLIFNFRRPQKPRLVVLCEEAREWFVKRGHIVQELDGVDYLEARAKFHIQQEGG